ncbi:hypothetical protein JTE90_016483 [Oedothorax gibbosus]|uniref:Aminotransferase class I/classII large domain-containing protein n=1 Tax=Oedothorax gibbosus TaxID=931172 RepID=A0AAV6V7R2_9ARAC|nr:hypothetical protein JTE90_016483 [Oedothorax gibbosus]
MEKDKTRDISKRAETVRNWEDFLNKFMNICNHDEYDEEKNPEGYINLGTAVNNMCLDIILPKLTSSDVWTCNPAYLQYREGYGIMRLRKALAAVMTEFLATHEPVDPNNLFCFTGVTSCIDTLAHCLADRGEVILTPTPIYGRIRTDFMQRSGVKMWPIPIITHDNTEDFPILTVEKVKKAYDSAVSQNQVVRALFLINPNNPLGDICSPELLMDIFNFCQEHGLHVIVDEVYALSIFEGGQQFHSTLKFSNLPDKTRTHVLYGISKDFGIAGLRVGAVHTQCKALQNCLKQLSFFQNIPFPLMDIAARFIEDLDWCKSYIKENQKRLTEKFQSCVKRIKQMGLNVRQSEGGFFLWVDFRKVCGSESFDQEKLFFHYLMEKAKLYFVPGAELFCEQPGWFRLTFTNCPDHVNEGLNRLEEAVRNYKRIAP